MATKTTVKSGRKNVATAGVAEALLTSAVNVRSVKFKAPSANTGNIFIGDSDVGANSGYVLEPGETLELRYHDPDRGDVGTYLPFNLADIYVDCAVNGEGVSFIYGE